MVRLPSTSLLQQLATDVSGSVIPHRELKCADTTGTVLVPWGTLLDELVY